VNYRHPINIAEDKVWKLSREIMGDAIGMGIIHALSVMLNIMAAQGAMPVQGLRHRQR
jgi:antitoxin component of RelBE/YafQ-DinJ toxin-antitoxin module